MTVMLQDCQKMLGLRIHGNAVMGQYRLEGWRARVEAFLGREVGDQGARTSGVLISWLRQEFAQCPEEADEETVGYYCRAWILHLFTCVLFPDATGDTALWMWVHYLSEWDKLAVLRFWLIMSGSQVSLHVSNRRGCTFGTRLDRQKNRNIFDREKHHQNYIEKWEEVHDNMDENNEPHTNRKFWRYQAWYQRATCCRLWQQWTEDDYADIESSDDEDTAYDQSTRTGKQVQAGPILDRVDNTLKCSVEDIEHFRPRVRDDDTHSFLDIISVKLILYNRGCHVGYAVRLLVVVAG
ncbi:uncharacterized protein [Miscanthus floridulus]|uniref:uncharacterized protein n=1 Tax=Miscanthus floridulus TaxID=154761 RepID=UPI00345A2D1C